MRAYARVGDPPLTGATPRSYHRVTVGALVAIGFFVSTGVANVFGYVTLAGFLGAAVLGSAYVGLPSTPRYKSSTRCW